MSKSKLVVLGADIYLGYQVIVNEVPYTVVRRWKFWGELCLINTLGSRLPINPEAKYLPKIEYNDPVTYADALPGWRVSSKASGFLDRPLYVVGVVGQLRPRKILIWRGETIIEFGSKYTQDLRLHSDGLHRFSVSE